MVARTRERLAVLEREIALSRAYPCDVTDEAQLDATLEAIRADLGAPKVLIHNAVGGAFGNFLEIDPQVLNRNFQVNTMALLYLARRLAPEMTRQEKAPLSPPVTLPPFAARRTLRALRRRKPRSGSGGSHRSRVGTKGSARCLRDDRCGH